MFKLYCLKSKEGYLKQEVNDYRFVAFERASVFNTKSEVKEFFLSAKDSVKDLLIVELTISKREIDFEEVIGG